MKVEETADEDGYFEVTLAMVGNDDDSVARNHIEINVTDIAGNSNTERVNIDYEPGCDDWHVGKVDSYPMNIYSRELKSGVRASAFFPIQFMRKGTPRVSQVVITKDDANRYLMDGETDMTELVEIDNVGAKASQYDQETDQMYVYVPIQVKEYRGSVDKLPDKLNVFLDVQIEYEVDGQHATCSVYPVVQFDLHKPELITQWLSPTMINNTIKMLDNMINNTENMVETLRTWSLWGLIACGAMIAMDYLKGFASSSELEAGEVCTDAQEGMESTY
jgi:hypothetical protein